MDSIEQLTAHVVRTSFDDFPQNVVDAAKKFVLDSIGVGIAGSSGPWVGELVNAQESPPETGTARVWGRSTILGAHAAALCNAYQMHNSEYDCVHEKAVIHPLTVVLAASLADIDRVRSTSDEKISGRRLIKAVTLGIDVACHLGVASESPLRFFRPGTCGAFGATAAVATLRSFDADRLTNAFGIVLAQLCGTMQAHTEGSPLLGMQMGFNARNALTACDLAEQGIPGPRNILEGPFGFYALFEGSHRLAEVIPLLGKIWRITEVAHKPFPSGRATHGIVEACLTFRRERPFDPASIRRVSVAVPPLTHHLVGRPVKTEMDENYARLCAQFVAARALIGGNVVSEDFTPTGRHDSVTLDLASRVDIKSNHDSDPNALSPIQLEIENTSGSVFEITIDTVIGHPSKPMDRDAWLTKFRNNWRRSIHPLTESACERVIDQIDVLPSLKDTAMIVDELVP